jgi:IS5 family transposase
MRQERTIQASLLDLFAGHEIGRELKAISGWLDEHPELIVLAAGDLRRRGVGQTGLAGGVGVALRAAQAAPPAEL